MDIEGTNRTYEGAIRACADNGREIKDRLESIGLRRESLKTVSQTVKPHYKEISYRDVDGDKTYKRIKDGFEFSNVLRFEFPNDNEILAKAMGSMMAATCQPDVHISFLNSDPVRCREAAIADAAKDARRKAEILAEAMGCRLGPLMDVSYGTQMSRDRYENDGFAPVLRLCHRGPGPRYRPGGRHVQRDRRCCMGDSGLRTMEMEGGDPFRFRITPLTGPRHR